MSQLDEVLYDGFLSKFKKDEGVNCVKNINPRFDIEGFTDFFELFSGISFNGGLYHVLPYENIDGATNAIQNAFPQFAKRIIVFAFDWLGRAFAIDGARRLDNEPLILMFDLSNNEVVEVPCTFIQFHNEELVTYTNDLLASEYFQSYLVSGGRRPAPNECCASKVPSFLGGSHAVCDLEIIDVYVFWHITGQLLLKL